MENRIHNEKILVLADDDFVRGVNKGYYPEFEEQKNLGNIGFVTSSEAMGLKSQITKIPKAEAIYLLNPYSGQYVLLNETDIEDNFIIAEALAVKRAMLNMGAHCVILSEEIKNLYNSSMKGEVGVNNVINGIKVKGDYEKKLSINLNTNIRELNCNNKPSEINVIRDHLIRTGLIGNTYINDYFSELCNKGELHGSSNFVFHFLSELKSVIDIAADMNYGAINANLNFSSKSIQIHEISKQITVYFDDVPDCIIEQFSKNEFK